MKCDGNNYYNITLVKVSAMFSFTLLYAWPRCLAFAEFLEPDHFVLFIIFIIMFILIMNGLYEIFTYRVNK